MNKNKRKFSWDEEDIIIIKEDEKIDNFSHLNYLISATMPKERENDRKP